MIASLANPVIPVEPYAVFIAVAVPVRPVIAAAFTVPDVAASIEFRSDTDIDPVSLNVTASLPSPVTVPAVFAA